MASYLDGVDRKTRARLLDLLIEQRFRRIAKQLVPNIGDPPAVQLLAPHLCKWTGLQPSEFLKLNRNQLVTFIEFAIEQKTGQPPKPEQEKIPNLVLNGLGKEVFVSGKLKPPLTDPQYNVLQTVRDAGSKGLNKDQLAEKSGHTDAVRILKRIAAIDADWKSLIGLAGKPGGRYRIIDRY